MTGAFNEEKKQIFDSKPQDVFYISEYLSTIEEFHTFELFQIQIDDNYEEKGKLNQVKMI